MRKKLRLEKMLAVHSREVALVEVKLRRGRFYCATTVVSDTMLKANTVHKCNII